MIDVYFKPFTQGSCTKIKLCEPYSHPHHKTFPEQRRPDCCCTKIYSCSGSEANVRCRSTNCHSQAKHCFRKEITTKEHKENESKRGFANRIKEDYDTEKSTVNIQNINENAEQYDSQSSGSKKEINNQDSFIVNAASLVTKTYLDDNRYSAKKKGNRKNLSTSNSDESKKKNKNQNDNLIKNIEMNESKMELKEQKETNSIQISKRSQSEERYKSQARLLPEYDMTSSSISIDTITSQRKDGRHKTDNINKIKGLISNEKGKKWRVTNDRLRFPKKQEITDSVNRSNSRFQANSNEINNVQTKINISKRNKRSKENNFQTNFQIKEIETYYVGRNVADDGTLEKSKEEFVTKDKLKFVRHKKGYDIQDKIDKDSRLGNGSNKRFNQHRNSKILDSEFDKQQRITKGICELDVLEHDKQNRLIWDKKIDRMQKDLSNERRRTLELESKLEDLTYSIKCHKEEADQRTACLKDALEKAEEQAKLAARSRNLAMDLAKQSRDQIDMMKASNDELLGQISSLQEQMSQTICKNTKLTCECEELKYKLKTISENEAKKCTEVANEVDRIKYAVKQKEDILTSEKSELKEMVAELTNVVKIQKKRICELSNARDTELYELQCKVKSMTCKYEDMKEENENLKCRLNEETRVSCDFKKELEKCKENQHCELKIKEKIIEDQDETIKKLKRLMQESEKMAKQAAHEFEQLTDELYDERETNNSLRAALETAETQFKNKYSSKCKACETLETEIDYLKKQTQKALTTAKFAAQKLCESTSEFQKQLECEKRESRFLTIILQKKEEDLEYLKQEISRSRKLNAQKRNDHFYDA